MNRSLRTIAFALVVALACTASAWASGAEESDGPVTLTVSHFRTEEDRQTREGSIDWQMIQRFEEQNPDVILEQQILDHEAYETRIAVLAAANELPDVFWYQRRLFDNFMSSGLLRPLDDLMAATPEFTNSIKPGVLDQFTVDGQVYAIYPSRGGTTHFIYYNEDILQQAGYTAFPDTWSGFLTMIGDLRDIGTIPIAFGNKNQWVAQSCYFSELGARFTGPEFAYSIANGDGATFADPDFIDGLYAMLELVDAGAFNEDFNVIDAGGQRELYYNGDAAMFIEGDWVISLIEENALDEVREATNITVFPDVGTEHPQLTVSQTLAFVWGVNADVEGATADAAWRFLRQLTGEEAAPLHAMIPKTPIVDPGEYDDSGLTRLQRQMGDIIDRATMVPIYDAVMDPALVSVINSGFQELLAGIITPEEFSERLEDTRTNL